MSFCISCKNRNSLERCPSYVVKGTSFCGIHLKVRNHRIWSEVNNIEPKVIFIQKVWRGYSIRNRIKLAGPGALNRSVCHNDEELVLMIDKKSVSPLTYFGFEEAGKIYWFDIRSISEYALYSKIPSNPYTREKLTIDTRVRLRKLCTLRSIYKLANSHDITKQQSLTQKNEHNWNIICQIIEENGFFDINPIQFSSLNKTQLFIFLTMIGLDIRAWASEHTSKYSRRHKYKAWVQYIISNIQHLHEQTSCSFHASKLLLTILNDCNDNYSLCFIIMSSLYRL